MANMKLLQEAIQAFANGNNEIADKKMRKYFVEQAQEINKKLEEEMEEEVCEDINSDPEEDMTDEIGYKLNEGGFEFDDGRGSDGWEPEDDHSMNEEEEEDFDIESDDGDVEVSASSTAPDADQWETIKTAFEDLERMFDEIEGGSVDFEDDESNDFGNEEEEVEDEFSDVQFGDEQVGEAFQMKKVSEPEKTEKAGVNKKSVVAPNAKSPVDGVKPVTIKDGTVDATDDKFENSDAMTVKVEDNNNVMDNGKHVMKPAKTPKNTAEKSRSPLPKSQPKL
ncbi:hypothetical protein [Yersinia phage fHe-Yen9-04]|uniref:Uncharacterized protein n=2 Tax=Eneladusvirus Yen904 TaxID=2560849 RepID=A0A2C9CX00_9CAUD|nr:virion structural protein [Yersinia phage fHe-Yen9-04]SOK58524.1 hypothetical protein [Yersinia phage fHe-Yen9-04]SOK59058.1 hypothetical protein [Yersinia phage fHe-Yen9-03]VUE36293.1 hypothetical protein [Yersinia phage fHe-Yen9-04]